jgi:hypothetical protein
MTKTSNIKTQRIISGLFYHINLRFSVQKHKKVRDFRFFNIWYLTLI